jgi:flagellar motility protein MotE (MotC chaperone)
MEDNDEGSVDTNNHTTTPRVVGINRRMVEHKKKRRNGYQQKYRRERKKRWNQMHEELFGQQLELALQHKEIEVYKERIKELEDKVDKQKVSNSKHFGSPLRLVTQLLLFAVWANYTINRSK